MKKAIINKAVLSLIILLMAACAPSISRHDIDGGRVKIKYLSTVTQTIQAIVSESHTISLPDGYERLTVSKRSGQVLKVYAQKTSNSSSAENVDVLVTIEQRNNYVHVDINPNKTQLAYDVRDQIVKILDKHFPRYQEGLLPKKQYLSFV